MHLPGLGMGQMLRKSHPCELGQVRGSESMRYINISVNSQKKQLKLVT